MSRSYKKNPFVTDKKTGKRFANNRVRKLALSEDALGCKPAQYKRVYPQYDICDYCFYWSKEYSIMNWQETERFQQLQAL